MKTFVKMPALICAAIAAALWFSLVPIEPGPPVTAHAATGMEPTYVGNSSCKLCHNKKSEGEQWNTWKKMMHATAYETLSSDAALAAAKAHGLETAPNKSAACLQCHVTGYDIATELVPAKIKMAEGIQCESCHGPGSEHIKDGKLATLKRDEAALARIRDGRIAVTSEKCVQCHNDTNPTWNPEKYTLKDGTKTGFDFDQAFESVAHLRPEKAAE
jgi:nitrate reductase cytochrome c-type subunit